MNNAIKAVLVAAGLFIAWNISSVILLVFASILFASGLQGIAFWIHHKTNLGRKFSLALIIPLITIIIVSIGIFTVPNLEDQYTQLAEQFPQQVQQAIQSINNALGVQLPTEIGLQNFFEEITVERATTFLGSSLGILADILIFIIITIYLTVAPKQHARILKQLPRHRQKQLHKVQETLRSWLGGRMLSMGVIFVLTTVGLLILGVPYAFFLGVLAGLLSFIPNLGPLLALIPATIVGLSNNTQMAFYILLLYGGIQLLESYLITPQIDRKTVSLPPAIQLISQLVFGALFGFMGLVLAVPITLSLRTLFFDDEK
jgi:predicted PurR-regulated permease PerM